MKKISSTDLVDVIKEGKVVVFFKRSQCGFCDKLQPLLNEIVAMDYKDVTLYQYYVAKDDVLHDEICKKEDITSFPQMFFYKDGKLVRRERGYKDKAGLRKVLDEFECVGDVLECGLSGDSERRKLKAKNKNMDGQTVPEKTITDFTETELKAMAYDNLAQIERSQMNLKAINEELARRNQPK